MTTMRARPIASTSRERSVSLTTYEVRIGAGLLASLGAVVTKVAPAHRYAIVTDGNVGPLHGAAAIESVSAHVGVAAAEGEGARRIEMVTIPPGEAHKTRDTWSRVTDDLLAAGFGRDTTIVALGGGVVGDLAGFVAATFMRGVPYVQVPTTLLAMIDASVGGKTGVDTPAGKNLVGAFHQPAAVVADTNLLATLPNEHLRAGLAEAIKHGVIADAEYFERVASLAANLASLISSADTLVDLVTRSVEIKAEVVTRDERERGLRKTLNFGHTIGHAIELCSDYRLLHGDAVAIGMAYESTLGERLGITARGTAARIHAALRDAGLPIVRPSSIGADAIVRATHGDKKTRAGRAEYALPAGLGSMAGGERGWAVSVPDDLVREVLA